MWAEIVAFDLPDPDVTSITESVNERHGDLDEAAGAADAIACSGAAVCVG